MSPFTVAQPGCLGNAGLGTFSGRGMAFSQRVVLADELNQDLTVLPPDIPGNIIPCAAWECGDQ
jgi:hypothetical protein